MDKYTTNVAEFYYTIFIGILRPGMLSQIAKNIEGKTREQVLDYVKKGAPELRAFAFAHTGIVDFFLSDYGQRAVKVSRVMQGDVFYNGHVNDKGSRYMLILSGSGTYELYQKTKDEEAFAKTTFVLDNVGYTGKFSFWDTEAGKPYQIELYEIKFN